MRTSDFGVFTHRIPKVSADAGISLLELSPTDDSLESVFAYLVGHAGFSDYLQLHYVPGSGELSVFCGALVGGGLGFLWFNAPPAKVFMGDTGSLSLGGALGTVSVITKHELVLAIVGGLFLLETVSSSSR